MSETAEIPAPDTPEELLDAAQAYAETVPLDVPLQRVEWDVSYRAKRHAGSINVHLMGDDLCNPITITLTWQAYEELGWERMQETITHELIHLWEYDNFGESSHGERFKQKADELGVSIHCGQFADPRYIVSCRACDKEIERLYNRSKTVQVPHHYHHKECEEDDIPRLQVYDTELDATWVDGRGFREAHPDADSLTHVPRYRLECAHCGLLVRTYKEQKKAVRFPSIHACGECDCEQGLRVYDLKTGDEWTSRDEMPS